MTSNFAAKPTSLDLSTFCATNWTSLRSTKFSPGVYRKHLRLLLGKALYEALTSEETIELFHVIFRLGELREPTFVQKHGFLLFLLLGIRFDLGPQHVTNALRTLKQIYPKLLPHSREYYSRKSALLRSTLQTEWREPKKFPPKRHVGIGYNDFGCRKNLAWDGNPSWQEVAMDEGFQQSQKASWRFDSPVDARSLARHWSG